MKKKILKNLFLSVLFAGGFSTLAAQQQPATLQDDANVRLLNVGEMNVRGGMYVQGGVGMYDAAGAADAPTRVQVVHNGETHIEGNFWQDTRGNVFVIEPWNLWEPGQGSPRGATTSTGTIHFVDGANAVPSTRWITTSNLTDFDRVHRYVAFPNLMIDTHDRIEIPPRMGIDAYTIGRDSRLVATPTEGVIVLKSRVDYDDEAQWNASLRVTRVAQNVAERPVAADAVVVEKYVWYFRETKSTVGAQTATPFMPFAAPYWDMRAGYFAGHWVRRPIFEIDRNSVNAPLGNRAAAFPNHQVIGRDQFVIDVHEPMGSQAREATARSGNLEFRHNATRQGYLVQFQPQNVAPDTVNQLNVTDGAHTAYVRYFVFDGHPFPGAMNRRPDRRLFAGQPILVEQAMLPAVTNPANTQNWLIGNSYTSGLNTREIVRYLMGLNTEISELWIFPHGGTGYEPLPIPVDASGLNDAMFDEDIQAMGVFLVRLNNRASGTESVTIGPEFQVHTGGISAFATAPQARQAGLRSMQEQNSRLSFVLTPQNNPLQFSRSEILFSADASLDADNLDIAAIGGNTSMFQLFGTNNTTARLQRNALPHTAEMALLGVAPAADEMWVTLTAIGADDFPAQMIELYDRQTGQFIQDLRTNNRYTFLLAPGDNPNRFEVRFTPRNGTTYVEDIHIANWSIYNNRSELTVTGLSHTLIGETMRIFNAAGVLHIQQPITSTVEHINIQDLPSGVYLITIQGRTERFVK